MAIVKTSISINKALFEQAESVAQELKMSRSRLVAMALEEFIRQHQDLLIRINETYQDDPDPDEQVHLRKMRRTHRQVVEGQW